MSTSENTLYIAFKTRLTEELNIQKLGLDEYLVQTGVVALAFAVDDGDIQFETAPFSEDLLSAAAGCGKESGENWLVMGHNIDFHRKVWLKKMGWPEPWNFGCTLKAARKQWPDLKSHSLKSLVNHLGLPPRIEINEALPHSIDELRTAAVRDISLVRAVAEIIQHGQPKSGLV